jgi:type IV pilus assembly protein PilW
MVIRGPMGSAQETMTQTYYPFGRAANASGGAAGSALSSSNDAGTIFTPAADSRLRQVVTFTIHLRNDQGL